MTTKLKAAPIPTQSLAELVLLAGIMKEGDHGANVEVLQQKLRNSGQELVIDGNFGPTTRAAVERFQAASRIAADGMVGTVTASYLDAVKLDSALPNVPLRSVRESAPWLTYMRALSGSKEIPGAKSNPLILSWVKSLAAKYPELKPNISWYTNDDTPWCGLAVAEAVGNATPSFNPPAAPLRALNWASWGQKLSVPIQGAIAVKKRKGGGHVTIVEGQSPDGKTLYCRGGNQSNMINVASYPTSVFTTFRWPPGALLPFPLKPTIVKSIASLGQVVKAGSEA